MMCRNEGCLGQLFRTFRTYNEFCTAGAGCDLLTYQHLIPLNSRAQLCIACYAYDDLFMFLSCRGSHQEIALLEIAAMFSHMGMIWGVDTFDRNLIL